jgi:O-antigen/teichoic acid export membrane protein
VRDEARLIFNSLLSYGSQAVTAAVGLFMVPYLIGALGHDRYGVIGIAGSILTLVVLIELGLRPAAARQFTRFLHLGEHERANELASTALLAYAGIGVTIVAVAVLVGDAFLAVMQLTDPLRAEAWPMLVVVAASFAVVLLQAPYEAALASRLRYDVTQYCQAGGAVFRAALIVLTFSFWRPALIVWAGAALLWSAVSLLIHRQRAHVHVSSLDLRRAHVSRRGARDLVTFGAWASVNRLAQWLSEYSGPMIVSAYLGPQAVALYTPAIVLVVALQPLHRAFLGQLTPVVTRFHAEGAVERIARVLERSTRYGLLIGGGAIVLVAALAFPLIRLWLGEGFAVTALVLIAWCMRSLLQAAAGGSFAVFMGTGEVRVVALINVVLALGGVSAALYLIDQTRLGVLAPALAMLAAQVVRSAIWFLVVTRIADLNRLRYLRRAFAGPLLCLAVLGSVALGVQHCLVVPDLIELVAAAAGAGVVFLALTWALGLNAEDRSKVRGYAQSLRRRARPGRRAER